MLIKCTMIQQEIILPSKVDAFLPFGTFDKPSTGEGFILINMNRTIIPKKASGIYQIKSKINGKIYIGSAAVLNERKIQHFRDLMKEKHSNIFLQRHTNKYGLDDLIFGILEFCPKEKLIEREQYWMDTLNPEFNICKVAGSSLGRFHTKETKQRIKTKLTGRSLPEETKQRILDYYATHTSPNKGKKFSEKTKEKISIARKGRFTGEDNPHFGKKHSEESIQKMKDTLKGRIPWNKRIKMDPSIGEKIGNSNRGRQVSEETRLKQSIKRKGKKATMQHRENISKGLQGHYISEETKRKISETLKNKKYGTIKL